jgi:hypothetical protein
MWTKGDRVLAWRSPGKFWYPGVIRHIQEDRYFIIYDDGEDGFVKEKEMMPFQLEVGDRIYASPAGERDYEPARIVDKQEDQLQLQYDSGTFAWAPTGRIRIEPGVLKTKPSVATEVEWRLGDRVFACWHDLFWYAGSVLNGGEVGDGGAELVTVVFDHGGVAKLPARQIHTLALREGEIVQGRWKAGNEFYPGKVVSRDGDLVEIDYDDGDHETTLIRLLRLERDEWLPDAEPAGDLGQGDRVLAQWFDGFWYPGIILTIQGKRIHILFDDNDQANLTWDKIHALDLKVGDRVFSRWKGGPFYYAAEIARMHGERIFLKYEDGREEWSSVRLVRVER